MNARIALAGLFFMLVSAATHADTFQGYGCTQNCSGHQAGYSWAEDNEVDDESSCSTPSNSFNEGCKAYVEENESSVSTDSSDDNEDEDDEDY